MKFKFLTLLLFSVLLVSLVIAEIPNTEEVPISESLTIDETPETNNAVETEKTNIDTLTIQDAPNKGYFTWCLIGLAFIVLIVGIVYCIRIFKKSKRGKGGDTHEKQTPIQVPTENSASLEKTQ